MLRRHFLMAAGIAALLIAIPSATAQELPLLKPKEHYKVGFSQPAAASPWRKAQLESMKAEAAKLGHQLVHTDAIGSADKQVADVNAMITQGVDLVFLAPHDVSLYQIMSPGRLDLISVVFASKEDAGSFEPSAWFGPDVTTDSTYQNRAMALKGLPALPDVPLSDTALHSLLDSLDSPMGKEQEHLLLSERPQPSTSAEAALSHPEDEDASDLDIEDSVIRELARSLRLVRQ